MNHENLHEIIRRYTKNYTRINNEENDEIFKWRAVRRFQQEWFSFENSKLSFADLFTKAKSECSVLIDNSTVSPANGIVKMAQQEPEEVERLFRDVLFTDDSGDLDLRQKHMEEFLAGIETVRVKHFPGCWKYNQDRHAASCYLTLYAPERNYIYKYTPTEMFAQHIEFGKDIGSGDRFSLKNYYEMCDLVVEALREHPDLLDAYRQLLSDSCYHDQSLHLLAFDVIYCASTYGLFTGLQHKSKKESIKAYTLEQLRKEEAAKLQEQIDALEAKIQTLEIQLDVYRSINLVGIRVFQKQYGEGTIVWQDVNMIRVQFASEEKVFTINAKFMFRPTFEDDTEIVAAMTDYATKLEEVKSLRKQLESLYK